MGGGIYRISTCDAILWVLTSSPSRHRTRTTKEAFEDRHVPCTLTRDSHFPRMGVLPAHRSRDRGRMTIHGVQCIRRTRHAHVHALAWAPRSERARSAPCLGAPLCSPRSARVARALQTQPGQQWQRTAGSLRRTRSQGRHRGARQAPPHSALRASLGHPHLAPRSARRSGASNAAGPAVAAYTAGSLCAARAGIAARGRTPPRSARRAALGHPHRAPRSARRAGASNAAGPAVAAYGRQPAAHRRSQGRERGARQDPTSLRAPRVARTPSPRSALRASLGRFKRSRAGSGSVRQAASGAQTQPGPGSRREEEGPTSLRAPRVARTPPPIITSLRAPRGARNARPHARSALVAPCVGRWRAALAR